MFINSQFSFPEPQSESAQQLTTELPYGGPRPHRDQYINGYFFLRCIQLFVSQTKRL